MMKSFRLPKDLWAEVAAQAKRESAATGYRVTRTDIVRRALRKYIGDAAKGA